jgi:hypothetical protein
LELETPTKPAKNTKDASWTPNPPIEIGRRAEAHARGTVAIKIYNGKEIPRPTATTYAITADKRLSPTDRT